MSAVITSRCRAGSRVFAASAALLFAVLASATVLWSASMSDMGETPMPGGWSLSMIWMRMPDQTWLSAGAAFLGMWTVMMAAMMLPSLAPALWHRTGGMGPARMDALIGAGYLSVWIVLGVVVYLMGIALTAVAMNEPAIARAVPIGAGVVVLSAGALQFTRWKAHQLALCRESPCSRQVPFASALRCGVRLGVHCCLCSAGFTAILLVFGLMDLRAMAAVTAAITIERIAPAGERVARAIGAAALVAGLVRVISAA